MRKMSVRALVSLFLFVFTSAVWAAPPQRADPVRGVKSRDDSHDKKHPLGARQRENRREGLRENLKGHQRGRTHRLKNGRYVELEQTRSDRLFVILVEFGDQNHPSYPDGTPGPLHNQITEPDRLLNNSTIWQPDFNAAHYADIVRQMHDYYSLQSSGRYGLEGQTTEWVRLPYNEARYGRNDCGNIVCNNVWSLIRDGINQWTADRLAEGMTLQQIHDYLATFDVWDRYDYNGNGNFDEPDGYIDHFLIVHSGEGEETGGGAQGEDAIWSHRWYASFGLIGEAGPDGNPSGGTQFGASGVWVGDYTMEPENGGLGVFAHEFGHDLGLPDEYDTAGGENSTGFWTLMSSGSYLNDGTVDIGSRPGDLNAWDKLQLGWLNYAEATAGQKATFKLGPAEYNTSAAQGLLVVLPDRARTLALADPPEGDLAWWSDMGNDLDNAIVRTIEVPPVGPILNMMLWYEIEEGWDYAYASVSADGGASWQNLEGNLTTNDNPNGQNEGNGITGTSAAWTAASFDLSLYAGQTVLLRLRYWTDGAAGGRGFLADAISVGSWFDGAENGPDGWTLTGFKETSGLESFANFNAYIAENRQYLSYDTGLKTGPYNFGFADTLPGLVEHFPYQNGLLIGYWDDFYVDNNTSQHPGEGLFLPVDAHPDQLIRPDGLPWRARIQSYDSTFGLQLTDSITVHRLGLAVIHPSLPAVPIFDDLQSYFRPLPESPASAWAGVIVPRSGTQIRVLGTTGRGKVMQVQVLPSPTAAAAL